MAVRISSSPVRLSVLLSGELDHHTAAAMRAEADGAILGSAAKTVNLDFGAVSFMDSSGVGFVMGRYRLARARGARVEVTNLSKKQMKIMKMSGLDGLVTLKERQENQK